MYLKNKDDGSSGTVFAPQWFSVLCARTLVMLLLFVALPLQAQDGFVGADRVWPMSITTEAELNAQEKEEAYMKVGDYEGAIGIKLRGNSSLSFNQKKYTIELRDEYGIDTRASLLGLPAHSDWVLLAPYNDVSAVRDPLAFHLWRAMGHWAPRTRMVELTLNGDYRGIYILSEAIKRDSMRVNISKLKRSDISGRDLTGGYILRIDTYNEDDATFPSKVPGIGEGIMTSQITWSCIYPKKKKIQPEQLAYIEQFVDTVERIIQSEQFADPIRGYAHYIDVPSFVDYFIHTELSLNADGYKRSAYFYKEKLHADGTGGKLVAGPVWDYNLAFGICNFCNADNPEAWCFEGGNTQPTPAMWQRLLQDPAFRKAVKLRYKALRRGPLSNKAINSYIDRHAKLLAPYIEHHFETYPELLSSDDAPSHNGEEERGSGQMAEGHRHGGGGFPDGGYPGGVLPMIRGGYPGGGFPMIRGGYPGGGFPMIRGGYPGGGFPMMRGGYPGGGFPMMGGFPQGGELPPMGEGFPMMGGFGGDAISWFAAYRVSSYEEEITVLKQWLANRLSFLDRNIDQFDKGWEPYIQEPVEIQIPSFENMPQFNGMPPFGGGFPLPY